MRYARLLLLCLTGVSCGSDDDSDSCPPSVTLAHQWQVHYEDQGPERGYEACDPLSDGAAFMDEEGHRLPTSECEDLKSKVTGTCTRYPDQFCKTTFGYETYRGSLRIVSETRLEQDLDYQQLQISPTSSKLCWSKYKATYTR